MASPEIQQPEIAEQKLYIFRTLTHSTRFLDEVMGLTGLRPTREVKIRRPGFVNTTLVNTTDESLPDTLADMDIHDIREQLQSDVPSMARPLTVAVKGVALYGSRYHPSIGLTLERPQLDWERQGMISALHSIDRNYRDSQHKYKPHMTIVQTYSIDLARQIMGSLADQVPEEIELSKPRAIFCDRYQG